MLSIIEPARFVAALLLVCVYTGMCAAIFFRHRAARGSSLTPELGDWLVVHASQTGSALALARDTQHLLAAAGVRVGLAGLSQTDVSTLAAAGRVLLVVSTHGEGDPPDEAAGFADRFMDQAANLSGLHYGLLALGNDSYTHYCGFGRRLDAWLAASGARACFDRLEMNRGDESVRQAWRRELIHLAGTRDAPDWEGPRFDAWCLASREHLNPGSQGEPVYRIGLRPVSGVLPAWEAGDLVQVQVPGAEDHPREYSIASVPDQGMVELLVRLHRREDGSTGRASGWMAAAPVGTHVRLRLREHPAFRMAGHHDRKLILIGNGTGLAGLLSHLQHRARQTAGAPCWLFFGERQQAHDFLMREVLCELQRQGVLSGCEVVFSRDGGRCRYVQDMVGLHGEQLRQWVQDGAAILVCGSLQGMAEGVHGALARVLGHELLQRLQQQGRYLRDVY